MSKQQNTIMLTNPYINTILTGRVCLKPNFLDNNIYIHLKTILKQNVEKKCNKYGFIHTIHKIIDHKEGYMIPEDLTGSVVYDIKYSALVCLPQENTTIVCKINKMENNLFTAENGPILIILKQQDINKEIFIVDSRNVIMTKEGKKLEIGDYVGVYIKNKRFFSGDNIIVGVGRLDRICIEDEVEKYYNPQIEENEEKNNIIDI
jgi:DNA-directed RNA polymerase subunit E'/Rpb7